MSYYWANFEHEIFPLGMWTKTHRRHIYAEILKTLSRSIYLFIILQALMQQWCGSSSLTVSENKRRGRTGSAMWRKTRNGACRSLPCRLSGNAGISAKRKWHDLPSRTCFTASQRPLQSERISDLPNIRFSISEGGQNKINQIEMDSHGAKDLIACRRADHFTKHDTLLSSRSRLLVVQLLNMTQFQWLEKICVKESSPDETDLD